MRQAMVHEVFAETVRRYGERPALRVKRDGGWKTTTWQAYRAAVREVARALIALGVEPGQGVAIIGANSPEWLIAGRRRHLRGRVPGRHLHDELAGAGPLHHRPLRGARRLRPTPPRRSTNLSRRRRIFRFFGTVVQMVGTPATRAGGRAERAFVDGAPGPAPRRRRRRRSTRASRPRSPTTRARSSTRRAPRGEPKAVMLTHTNVTWTTAAALAPLDFSVDDVSISYLPLSHIAEQLLSVHGPMYVGSVLYSWRASTSSRRRFARCVPPSSSACRASGKIQGEDDGGGGGRADGRAEALRVARRTGLAGGYAAQRGEKKPLLHPLAKKLVHDKVREKLGLDRARLCVTSAAPIAKDTLEFFLSLGIPLSEVYGMSECTGPATYSPMHDFRTTTCGLVLPGTEVKIAEDGEICMRGPHVFKGYLKDPEATRAAIDADGWLHSGDIGVLEDGKYLRITDRKKDLLITAGGENIAPQLLEGQLKSIPVIGQAIVVGDRKKYLAALVTLDPERVRGEAEAAGSRASTMAEAAGCAIFREHLQKQIDGLNQKLARVQTIKRFTVMPTEFTVEGGELTPTMKLKRKVVNEKYRTEIDALYADV